MQRLALDLLEISVSTSVIIVAIMLLSSLINRSYTVKWKYWIWLVTAVRLLVPIKLRLPSFSAPVTVSIPDAPIAMTISPSTAAVPSGAGHAAAEYAAASIDALDLAMVIWAAETAMFIIWQVVVYILFRSRVTRWGMPPNASVLRALDESRRELSIARPIPVLVCKTVHSPMMTGFIKPLLILPDISFDERSLRYILRHELTHWRRRDVWYKALMLLANAVHWFNPAVWLMVREASRDLEISCDAHVMAGADMEERRRYSETILSCIHREAGVKTPLSTHFYGGMGTIK